MSTGLIVGLLLVAFGLLYARSVARRKQPGQRRRPEGKQAARALAESRDDKKKKQWHAVSLRAGKECCDSIGYVLDKVYLASEAPTLPLSSCERADCRCRYEHYADRRQTLRRDPYSQYGLRAALHHQGKERRSSRRGRREADLASA